MATAAPRPALAEAIRSQAFVAIAPQLLAYGGLLARTAGLPCATQAGDILHDAVELCIRGKRAWRPDESLEQCLRRAMLTVTKDMRKKEMRRRRAGDGVDETSAWVPRIDDWIDDQRRLALVERAVEGDALLTAMWDLAMEGVKRAEIAARLGVSPEEITHARRRLQERVAALIEDRAPVRRARAEAERAPDERTAPASLPTQDDKEFPDEEPRSARSTREAPTPRRGVRRRSSGAAG